jgi:hypothetical protein
MEFRLDAYHARPDDGGVYNKTTEASFSGSFMPDKVNINKVCSSKRNCCNT